MIKHQINIIFKDKSSGAINNQVKLHKFNNIDYNNSYGIKLWYNNGKQIIKYYNNFTDMRNNIEKLEQNPNVSIHEYFKHKDENQLL